MRYQRVPEPTTAGDISHPVDPWTLHRLRLENDFPRSTGYSYKLVGSESVVDEWIAYGLEQHFYDHAWLDRVDQLLLYNRNEANAAILDKW